MLREGRPGPRTLRAPRRALLAVGSRALLAPGSRALPASQRRIRGIPIDVKTNPAERAEASLRAVALGYPEAYEDHPWGDTVFKVKGKVFVFMGAAKNGDFGISTKLPLSNAVALMLPFAEPTRYGLGKSGWVSARFGPKDEVPLDMLSSWIDESYRAVAPKKLVAALPKGGATPPGKVEQTAAKKTTGRKAVKGDEAAGKERAARKAAPTEKAPAAKKNAAPARPATTARAATNRPTTSAKKARIPAKKTTKPAAGTKIAAKKGRASGKSSPR